MRKRIGCALMISFFLLLCACAEEKKPDAAQKLQEEYQEITACECLAKVQWESEKEMECYTLQCAWVADGNCTVEVTEPEILKGVRAEFDQKELTLVYEDVSLAAGSMGEELSPVNVLPMMMDAIRNGYILEKGAEEYGGEKCARILFDVTNPQGEKTAYTVWFNTGHLPVYAEVRTKDRVCYKVAFSDFSAQETTGDDA